MSYKVYAQPLQKSDGNWLLSDLYSAAWMNAWGHDVLAIEETPTLNVYASGPRVAFVFADKESFEADYRAFTAGDPIGIRRFLNAVYTLKRLMRDYEKRACRK